LDVIEGRGGGCWGVYVITCLVVYVANIPTGGRGMDWDGVLVYGGRGGGGGGGVGDVMWQGRDCCGWGWDFLGGVLHRMVLWEGKKGGGGGGGG